MAAAAVEEMGSVVGTKAQPRWVGPASDPLSGVGLAYAFGRRAEAGFGEVKKWLKPLGLGHC